VLIWPRAAASAATNRRTTVPATPTFLLRAINTYSHSPHASRDAQKDTKGIIGQTGDAPLQSVLSMRTLTGRAASVDFPITMLLLATRAALDRCGIQVPSLAAA
jgi:hypothetical protein